MKGRRKMYDFWYLLAGATFLFVLAIVRATQSDAQALSEIERSQGGRLFKLYKSGDGEITLGWKYDGQTYWATYQRSDGRTETPPDTIIYDGGQAQTFAQPHGYRERVKD